MKLGAFERGVLCLGVPVHACHNVTMAHKAVQGLLQGGFAAPVVQEHKHS